jgi:hypothetical protein
VISDAFSTIFDIGQLVADSAWENGSYLIADVIFDNISVNSTRGKPTVKVVN